MSEKPLRPGDPHYRAYVGPPLQYDFMGLTQLALLYGAGLREWHSVLDIGCGSLRAARLLIPFLEENRYCGIEPNSWLVEEGLEKNIGKDMAGIKKPRFDSNGQFDCGIFGQSFDFVLAQSILSHTKVGMARRCIAEVAKVVNPEGLFLCTFVLPGAASKNVDPPEDEWVYPGLVEISEPTIAKLFSEAGLSHWRLPWFHPRQTWFAAGANPQRLSAEDVSSLSGYVVNSEALRRR